MKVQKKKERKKEKDSLFKALIEEIRDSIFIEVIWAMFTFLPRWIFRMCRNIF